MIHFEKERFRLRRIPMYNKKARRHLGINKEAIRMVEVASGFHVHKGKRKYIQRTSPIVESHFDSDAHLLTLKTENGKRYQVEYGTDIVTVTNGETLQ